MPGAALLAAKLAQAWRLIGSWTQSRFSDGGTIQVSPPEFFATDINKSPYMWEGHMQGSYQETQVGDK